MGRHIALAVMLLATSPQVAKAESAALPTTKPDIDKVLVLKSQRKLLLMRQGAVLRSYRIALGRDPVGPKIREGDGRTPEGSYRLDWRNPRSRFYRSIHVSYPNQHDRRRARERGVAPGGDIMIHGLPNGREAIGRAHAKWDWTEGCLAVTNAEMDQIWSLVPNGTVIEILPGTSRPTPLI